MTATKQSATTQSLEELQARLELLEMALGELGHAQCGIGDLAQFGRRTPALASYAAGYRAKHAAAPQPKPQPSANRYMPVFNSTMDSQ